MDALPTDMVPGNVGHVEAHARLREIYNANHDEPLSPIHEYAHQQLARDCGLELPPDEPWETTFWRSGHVTFHNEVAKVYNARYGLE